MAKNNVSQKNNQFENFCEKYQCTTRARTGFTKHSGLIQDIQFGVLCIAKKYHFVKNRYQIFI